MLNRTSHVGLAYDKGSDVIGAIVAYVDHANYARDLDRRRFSNKVCIHFM